MKIAANQAIAACSQTSVTASGWQNGWCQTGTMYSSQEEARAAHNSSDAPIYPVYYVEGETADGQMGSAYWNDVNGNGQYDSNEYPQTVVVGVPKDLVGGNGFTTNSKISVS